MRKTKRTEKGGGGTEPFLSPLLVLFWGAGAGCIGSEQGMGEKGNIAVTMELIQFMTRISKTSSAMQTVLRHTPWWKVKSSNAQSMT